MSDTPRVALVYDRVNSWGGAERVLLELHKLFPDAPLFTSVYESATAPWAKDWDIRTSTAQRLPFLRTRHRLLGWCMPFLFEQFDFSEFDVVISVTSEFAKSIITSPDQLHICYVLTPVRYLWSHQEEYLESAPWLAQPAIRAVFRVLQRYDVVAASRPDTYVGISQLVADRVERYYHQPCSQVITPPLGEWVTAKKPACTLPSDYAVTWGRLVRYKHFESSIRAAVVAQKQLVVIGDGPDAKRLEGLARELDPHRQFVFFAGGLSEAELHYVVKHARVALFPQLEDFGISILEACLVGCPVIVQRKSGASELLGNTRGVYYLEDEKRDSLVLSLEEAWTASGNRLDIQQLARQYAGVRFARVWKKYLNTHFAQYSWRFSTGKTRKEL